MMKKNFEIYIVQVWQFTKKKEKKFFRLSVMCLDMLGLSSRHSTVFFSATHPMLSQAQYGLLLARLPENIIRKAKNIITNNGVFSILVVSLIINNLKSHL